MSMTSIVLTGIIAVFLIFVILYMIFILMEVIFRQKKPPKQESVLIKEKTETVTEIKDTEDENHIAIIGAVISEVLGKPVMVKNIYPGRTYDMQDRTTSWRKSGWKGARGWRASSGW